VIHKLEQARKKPSSSTGALAIRTEEQIRTIVEAKRAEDERLRAPVVPWMVPEDVYVMLLSILAGVLVVA
jgi:hypothetical protein